MNRGATTIAAWVTWGTGAILGSCLQNMRDRLEGLGGSLEVESTRGTGTTAEGHVPVALGINP